MLRSLKVSNSWLKRVKQALSRYDFSSQKALAEELQISPRKTGDFFNGKSIDYEVFIAICERLGLEWHKVAKVSPEITKSEASSQDIPKTKEAVQSLQPEIAKNLQEPVKQQTEGIPKLASSLFRTFEPQDYIPQKKFLSVKTTDNFDLIEESLGELADKSQDLLNQPVEKLISDVTEQINDANAPNSDVASPIDSRQPADSQELLPQNQLSEIRNEAEVPPPLPAEPLESLSLEIEVNLPQTASPIPTISPNVPIAAVNPPNAIPQSDLPQLKSLKLEQKVDQILDQKSTKAPANESLSPSKSAIISDKEVINPKTAIPTAIPESIISPIAQSYQHFPDSLEPVLTAFYDSCDSQDWDLAAAIINDINLTYIKKTSDLSLILDLYNQLLPPKWQDGEHKISDRLSHWQVVFNAGMAAFYLEKYTDAVTYYETALAIASNLEANTELKIKSLNGLGMIYQAVAQYQSAIKYFQQAQVLAKEFQSHSSELQALENLGNIYYALRQYRTAISYYQAFLQLANDKDSIELEFSIIGNLGNAYYNVGEYQTAINYQQKYLEIARMIPSSEKEAACLVSLGFAYYSLGLYQTAIEHYQKAKGIADEFIYQRIQLSLFSGLGLSYQALRNYATAVVCFHKCLEIAQKLGDRSAEVKALYNLRKANSYQ